MVLYSFSFNKAKTCDLEKCLSRLCMVVQVRISWLLVWKAECEHQTRLTTSPPLDLAHELQRKKLDNDCHSEPESESSASLLEPECQLQIPPILKPGALVIQRVRGRADRL